MNKINIIKSKDIKEWEEVMDYVINENKNNVLPFIDTSGHKTSLIKRFFNLDVSTWKENNNFKKNNKQELDIPMENKVIISFRDDKFYKYGPIVRGILDANELIEVDNINNLSEVLSKTSYKYIVLLLSYESMKLEIFNQVRTWSNNDNKIGYFGGEDVEDLSWLLLKTKLMKNSYFINDKSLIALPLNKEKVREGHENITVLNKNHKMTDIIGQAGREGLRSLFTSSHGSEDCVSLSDGFIYGASKKLGVVNSPPYGDNFTLASDINAQVVANSTCFGFRPNNNLLNKNVSLALSFLEGLTTVYISSEGIKHGPDAEISFLYNLLYYGNNVGDSVTTLNKWLDSNNFDFPCYFIIGDPSLVVYPEVESIENTPNILDGQLLKIEEIKRKSLVKVPLPKDLKFPIFIENTTFNKFSYSVVVDDEDHYLYLHNWWPFDRENIQLKIHNNNPLNLINFNENTKKVNNLVHNSIINGRFQNDIHALDHRLQSLAQKARTLPFNAQIYRELNESVCKYKKGLDKLQDSIMHKLMKQSSSEISLFLPEAYIDYINYSFKEVTNCYICNKESNTYIFNHLTSFEKREVTYCPRCGAIEDIPLEKKLKLEIVGEDFINDYNPYKQYLKICNLSNEYIEGYCGLSHDSVEGNIELQELYKKFTLSPKEDLTIEYVFNPLKKLTPHLYYFKAMALCEFELYHANKPFTNTPMKSE